MARPKIAVAGFLHETNTFAPMPTVYQDFVEAGAFPGLVEGEAVLENLTGINIGTGGFIDAGDDFDLYPIMWTFAEPGGYVDDEAFEILCAKLIDALAAAKDLDGVYLDLHGAMTTRKYDDAEAEVLARVRHVVRADLPVAVSHDLHANISSATVDRASLLTIYRTYPHVDMAATGARARALLQAQLERGEPFAKAFRMADFLIPLPSQSTRRQPARDLFRHIRQFTADGVDSIDLAFGFPLTDAPNCGPSLVAFGSDQQAVDEAADGLLAHLGGLAEQFDQPLTPALEAVREARARVKRANKPVVIADVQDNPGAGGTGDTTGLLKALVEGHATGVLFGMLWDPQVADEAHAAGLGGQFEAVIGGRFEIPGDAPYAARVEVVALSDGQFTYTGPMLGGAHVDLGKMAALRIVDDQSDVVLVVGSIRSQNLDQAIFTHLGLEPTDFDIVAVKSTIHFMAAYEPIASEIIFAQSPGANPCDLSTVPFTRLAPEKRLPGG